MLQRYDAVRFIKVLESGRTQPLLLECECVSEDDHSRKTFVVKAPGLPEVEDFGLFSELFSYLLAEELEIETPHAALIDLSEEFVEIVNPILRKWNLAVESGVGFGSEYMGPGFVAASGTEFLNPEELAGALQLFSFDLLIQNPDRIPNNPNCAYKDGNYIAFDFNLAFSFLLLIGNANEPWEFSKHQIAEEHLFYSSLRRKVLDYKPFIAKLEKLSGARVEEMLDLVPFGSEFYKNKVREHLASIVENAAKLEIELQRSLL